MEDAIDAKSGATVGFYDGKIIYDLQGQPVGRLRGTRVYCMGGHYVGVLRNGVIVDKKLNAGSTPARNSASSGARGNPGMRNHGSQRIRRNPRQQNNK
ncbi:MAG: 4-fold beta flower protein [Candidatus Acidiferrum sp.]